MSLYEIYPIRICVILGTKELRVGISRVYLK